MVTEIGKPFHHVGQHEQDGDMTRFLLLSNSEDPDTELVTCLLIIYRDCRNMEALRN